MNYFHVDSFAMQPFEGNPAGVCLLDEPVVPRSDVPAVVGR